MFTFLVSQSLKNRLLVLAIAAVLVLYGAFTVTRAFTVQVEIASLGSE